MMISVEPAADFGMGQGDLIVVPVPGDPGRVEILRADRVIYVTKAWMELVKAREIPWAEYVHDCPWTIGGALKINGADRRVVYVITGACGPAVPAYVCEQPD